MEANEVLLGLLIADSGLSIGAAGKDRIRESLGRLGISLTMSRGDVAAPESLPAIGATPLAITVDFAGGSIRFALNAPT